jgi:hypothetical protein
MSPELLPTTLQAAVSAASGLLGALIGGFISLRQSRESNEATFRNQIEIEELRFRQKLDLEQREHERAGRALLRSLIRSMKRLHNTARLSPKSRITLSSWMKNAAAFEEKMEGPMVDQLLSETQYEALWKAANEGRAAATLISIAAAGASHGHTPNPVVLRATVKLFRESLRDAFAAVSETERAREVEDEEQAGIADCGIFLDNNSVFYPDPSDGRSFIVG